MRPVGMAPTSNMAVLTVWIRQSKQSTRIMCELLETSTRIVNGRRLIMPSGGARCGQVYCASTK